MGDDRTAGGGMDLAPNQGIKVLRAGASWHGGDHAWSLPTRSTDGSWTPGDWTPRVAPSVCLRGWHLTTEPARWWGAEGVVRAYLDAQTTATQRGATNADVDALRAARAALEAALVPGGGR